MDVTINLPGGVPLKMVDIPPGSFRMGSTEKPDESPVHTVTINYAFQLGKFTVTQSQWYAVMKSFPDPQPTLNPDLPVVDVSWDHCQDFITKLNRLWLGTFRLPSEAEWEYACRAGTTTRWSHGNDESELSKYAWYAENSGGAAHVVGQKKPNPFGLYDMHGNVSEWCQDRYHKDYTGAPADGSAWDMPASRSRVPAIRFIEDQIRIAWEGYDCRVLRGGSWHRSPCRVVEPPCRVADRSYNTQFGSSDSCGFRVVRIP